MIIDTLKFIAYNGMSGIIMVTEAAIIGLILAVRN